jgi:carbonic anhydrase/acetyltransferase-like protein (isoleucine patch superfamily)
MAYRLIVGRDFYLELVLRTWKQACPGERIEQLEVPWLDEYEFDLSVLNQLNPDEHQVFIALDERFGNFRQAVMERGVKLISFVHSSAVLGDDVKIGANVFVGPKAMIGHGCRIDYNTVIHAGAHIGMNSRVKASCWIENGVQIGINAEIGNHSIVRTGAIVKDGVKVGSRCELGWPKTYSADVPNKTVFDARYDEPIVIYGA